MMRFVNCIVAHEEFFEGRRLTLDGHDSQIRNVVHDLAEFRVGHVE